VGAEKEMLPKGIRTIHDSACGKSQANWLMSRQDSVSAEVSEIQLLCGRKGGEPEC
jgi:hypothetical protein